MENYNIKYYVTEYHYDVKRNKTVETHTDKFTALNALFNRTLSYLEAKDGCEKIKDVKTFLFDKKCFRSALKASLTPGHYIIRDPESHVYKLEIWNKTVITSSGWFGASKDLWKKVFDIDIFEIEEKINNSPFDSTFFPVKLEILKSDISQASKAHSVLIQNLAKLESFKKLREDNSKIKELKENYSTEFSQYVKKNKPVANLLSESTIFETLPGGKISSYKAKESFIEFPTTPLSKEKDSILECSKSYNDSPEISLEKKNKPSFRLKLLEKAMTKTT